MQNHGKCQLAEIVHGKGTSTAAERGPGWETAGAQVARPGPARILVAPARPARKERHEHNEHLHDDRGSGLDAYIPGWSMPPRR